jgi:hypothetical protein
MSEPTKQVVKTGEVLPAEPSSNKIQLGAPNQIDLTGLTEQHIQQLRLKHADGMLELNRRAQELHVDVAAMNAGLDTMASTVEKVSKAGDAVTITNVQKNALGQTEVIMGNTEAAARGKISRAQRGDQDRTLWYVIIAAVVIIVIVMAFAK